MRLSQSHPHSDSRSIRGGNQGRGQRPHYTYYNRVGHTRDRCYQLQGCPPRIAHVAQSSVPPPPGIQIPSPTLLPKGVTLKLGKYEEYLRFTQPTKFVCIASVAQTNNVSAYLTHPTFLGPWILDSNASHHLSGNKDLFSSLTITYPLPMITLANDTQTMAKGFGSARSLPYLPLNFVLRV